VSGHGEKRHRLQEQAIAQLLAQPTVEAAAAAAGVGVATLRRWLRRPGFKKAYRAARQQVTEQAVARLQQAATEAVDALRKNLTCDNPAAVNTAAKAIIEQAIKGVEVADLVERVEELERLLSAGGPGDGGTVGADREAGTGGPGPGSDAGPQAV
jgi:DNA-binding MurR/RpiR family transcriptional regulator